MKIIEKVLPFFSVLLFLALAVSSILPFGSKVYAGWGDTCICAEERNQNGVCTGATTRMCGSSGDPEKCSQACSQV